MNRNNEPDPRHGGTFIRDKAGRLIQHIPSTRPHDAPMDREVLIDRVVEKIDSTIDMAEHIASAAEPAPIVSPSRRRRNTTKE